MGRKRQRSRATDDDEQPVDESESTQDHRSHSLVSDGDELSEEQKREVEVWDAFKEEHHEGPLPTHPPRRVVTQY